MKNLYTLLLLCPLLLSSCISTVHQYAARRALVAEEVLVLRTPIQDIWRVGDKFYVVGYLGKGRGIQRGIPIKSILYQDPEYSFELTDEHPREVFIELQHNIPGHETEKPEQFRANSNYLTALPTHAKKVTIGRNFEPQATSAVIGTPGTDAHLYYAYPLAAVLAIGVDAPVSLAMTGALIPTIGIGAVCAKIGNIGAQVQTANATQINDKREAVSDQAR